MARRKLAAEPVTIQCEPVKHQPGPFIGRCDHCGHLIPYGSGWQLVEAPGGSRLLCGPQQAHRPVVPHA